MILLILKKYSGFDDILCNEDINLDIANFMQLSLSYETDEEEDYQEIQEETEEKYTVGNNKDALSSTQAFQKHSIDRGDYALLNLVSEL